ncbi:MAG: hypothetical protein IKB31_07435 [Bacteroidaceae bacterium]|nr:hypothetical protein [Bacteroidaceae bacterium]
MKKNLLLLVLALIGMGGFTACNNEDELLVQEQTNTKPVVIRATIGNVSRLALGDSEGGKTKLTWGPGDAFALTIGGNSYTFNWVSGNDFEYNGSGFPETFETAGPITATYPATAAGGLSVQSGTKANVGNYMQMTASKEVTAGQPTTDLNLSFEHQTSVVEITLDNNQYANLKAVVELRTQAEAMYSTPTEDAQKVQFNGSGKLTVYFAVSPTDAEVSGWYIGLSYVSGDDTYYDAAPLSDLKLDASKMYKVSKGSSDLKMAYKIDDAAPSTVVAYNAIGLYKWREMATEDLTNNVINLKLGDNITLPTEGITSDSDGPVKGNWTPVGNSTTPYYGSIDGNNKIISNMYIVNKTNGATHQGFLGNSYEVTIKNITFDGAKIVVGKADDAIGGGKYVGVISGLSRANFENCHVTGSTLKCLANGADSGIMGGLVGSLSPGEPGKITNSSFNGTIDGRSRVGGIVGELTSSIGYYNYFASVTNCTAQGTIEGIDVVGGIAGWSESYIEECTNNAIVNGANSGGIVGVMDAYACTIGCTNNGEITGETYADAYGTGGIVGQIFNSTTSAVGSEIYVIACRNLTDKVTLNSSRKPGGIVGYQNRLLSGVYGSYTVKSTVDKSFSGCVGANPSTATNEGNKVFESVTDDDLIPVTVGVMNAAIGNAFTAMNSTSPKSPYVSSGNYNTYKDYCWTFLASDSWPVFFKKAGLSSVP